MIKSIFKDIKEYSPSFHSDYRGDIWTTWDQNEFESIFNENIKFDKDKFSSSCKNTLRGIHGDFTSTKLMTCVYGIIYYIAVDNKENSPTYLQWDWDILSSYNKKILLIPPGYGTAMFILSDFAVTHYKWSHKFTTNNVLIENQFTLKWNDERIGINWPITNPILSSRDK